MLCLQEALPISEAALCNTSLRNSRTQQQCLDPTSQHLAVHEPAGGKLSMPIAAVHINAPGQEVAIAQELKVGCPVQEPDRPGVWIGAGLMKPKCFCVFDC